jgi:hypothetical protein
MKQMSQMRNILQQSLTFRNGDLERDMRKFSTVLADFAIAGTNLQAPLT